MVSCDSSAQAAAYRSRLFVPLERLTALGAILSGDAPGRTDPDQLTLHCSTGLAGTEVVLAAELAGRADRRRRSA